MARMHIQVQIRISILQISHIFQPLNANRPVILSALLIVSET